MLRTAVSSALRRSSPVLFQPHSAPTRASMTQIVPVIRKNINIPGGLKVFHSTVELRKEVDKTLEKRLEKKLAKEKLECNPEEVNSTSSVRPILEQSQGKRDVSDMSEDLKNDINLIVDTVALRTVPREAYVLGLAGTLPYLATSLSTLYLGWDLNQTWAPGATSMFMLTHEHAGQLLAFFQPLQLGYGAVIISFLGAIHWGMEFNEKKLPEADRTRFRYTMGVVAPAIAWPTLMMPFEYALMSQMSALIFLYFADTRATTRGWTPAWYATYRFVLTFVVCTSIVLSLIGRQKVTDSSNKLFQGDELRQRMDKTEHRDTNSPKWKRIEKEEVEKQKAEEKEKKEAEKKEAEKKDTKNKDEKENKDENEKKD